MIFAFIVGILFALIAQYARLNSFNTIASAALLKNHDVAQILLFAIAISSIGFFVLYLLGSATISVKPFYVIGVCVGGILFGAGVAILGYCPGTMLMALAEGKADALLGYVGGITAALLFTLAYPTLLPLIGPDFGAINLYAASATLTALIVGLYAVALLFTAFRLERKAKAPSDLIN
jgi:hypothetical protein